MEPITREEYYLAKIAGTYEGKTPKPVTNDEYYLATMAGDYSGNTPQPVTRLQYYMAKVAGVWDGSIPAPVTRLEYYWAAIANGEGTVFPPVTREEHFLVLVADAYSVVLTVVTGNPALLENSKGNRGLESLTLYGKSTQINTTGAQLLPFEVGKKGINFEVFEDGIVISCKKGTDIYAVGRNNGNVESGYDEFALMTAGKYYIYSGTQDVYLYVVVWRKGKNVVLGYSVGTDAEQIEIMDGDKFRIFLRTTAAFKGKVKAMITRTPMNATSYEPYKPAQTLIIPTPNGLPGIPVSSDGNYTDADGQQWVCDEVDFKKGVYVQRIGKKTITSKDAFFKSGLSTNDVNYFALNNIPVHIGTAGKKDVIMSNCFVAGIYQHFGTLGEIFLGSAQGNIVYFSVEAQKYPDTETFKQWAVENGLMFLYQLADIVETHLTAEELSAYKTLRTYSPTTTVANDAEAGMSVGYAKMK